MWGGNAVRSRAAEAAANQLDNQFGATVKPFLQTYCVTCHGRDKPEAELNVAEFSSLAAVTKESGRLGVLVGRLQAEEMPPKKAKLHPSPAVRKPGGGLVQAPW